MIYHIQYIQSGVVPEYDKENMSRFDNLRLWINEQDAYHLWNFSNTGEQWIRYLLSFNPVFVMIEQVSH